MGNATWFCTLGIFGTARHHLENILPNPNFLNIRVKFADRLVETRRVADYAAFTNRRLFEFRRVKNQ